MRSIGISMSGWAHQWHHARQAVARATGTSAGMAHCVSPPSAWAARGSALREEPPGG